MSDVKCPKCKSENIFFRQEYTSFAYIDAIRRDGVAVGETRQDIPHPMSMLVCDNCGWEGGIRAYWKLMDDPLTSVNTPLPEGEN